MRRSIATLAAGALAGVALVALMAPTGIGYPTRAIFTYTHNHTSGTSADFTDYCANGRASNDRCYAVRVGGSGEFSLQTANDAGVTQNPFYQAIRTGTAATTFNVAATNLQHGGVDLSASSGTFNLTFATACTVDYVVPVVWYRVGKSVTWELQSPGACTSDSTAFASGTDIPVAIRPAGQVTSAVYTAAQDNSAAVAACWLIDSTGVVFVNEFVSNSCSSNTTWTAAGSKRAPLGSHVTYKLN